MSQSMTPSTVSRQEISSHVPEYDSFNRFSAGDNDVLGWASGRFWIGQFERFMKGKGVAILLNRI